MEGIQIENILMKLHGKRQIFHSEGDFQFSLGCEIQSLYPNIKITAERPTKGNNNVREHIDMFLYNEQTRIEIELKYIKSEFSGNVDGYDYNLPSAQVFDLSCYDITKDIHRLENYVRNKSIDIGYSIVLTNAPILWQKSDGSSIDDEFRVYDG